MKHTLSYLLPIPVLLSGLTACTTVHEHEYPPRDRVPYHEPRPVYSEYDYYFYPNVAVYLQISTGFYYYEDRGRWVRVRQLPPNIYLDSRYRRHLNIRDPYPYMRYPEHARQYGAREDDRDRRDDGRPERDLRPLPPSGDRHDRDTERKAWGDRESRGERDSKGHKEQEMRREPPMENRGQERRDPVVPGRARDDDRRDPRMLDAPRQDDKPRAYDKDHGPEGRQDGRNDGRQDGRPDSRRPSRDDAPPPRARGGEERGKSRDAGPSGKPDGSSRQDAGKPDGKGDRGGRARAPGGGDDDGDDHDRDRRAPGTR